MRVTITEAIAGCLLVQPVSTKQRRRIYKDQLANGMPSVPEDEQGTLFLQEGDAGTFTTEYVPRRKQKDLQESWDITINIDDWDFRQMCGWSSK